MKDELKILVGARLRRRRRLMGMTQQQVAAACGVSFQQVQKYECAGSRLSVDMLWKLASILEVDMAYFFSDAPRARLGPGRSAAMLAEPRAF